jgi:hypothetical protein
MRNRIFLFSIFILFTVNSFSQINIEGIIADKISHKAVKDMTIKVMDKDSIFIVGAISQKNGWFEVNNIKLSSVYLIECSGIGYERTIQKIKGRNTVDVSTLNADTIFVASSPYNLKEVVVKGESRKRQIDRIVIYPNKIIKESTNSAWGVLEKLQLPKIVIHKDGMSITTADGKNVVLKINGVPSNTDEFLSILPSQIKEVDYYDNPGIRYEGQNIGAVIDIHTKNYIDGYSAGIQSMDALTTVSTENKLHFKISHATSQFLFMYSNKYRDYHKSWTDTNLSFGSQAETLSLTKNGLREPYSYLEHNIEANYYYNLSGLQLNFKLNDDIYNCKKDNAKQDIYENNVFQYQSYSSPKTSYNSPSIDMYSSLKLSEKDNISLDILTTYRKSNYDYYYHEAEESGQTVFPYEYNVDGKRFSVISEALYERSLNANARFTGGLRYDYAKTDNDYTKDLALQDHSTSSSLFGYTQILGKVSRFSYQVGCGINSLRYQEGDNSYHKTIFRPTIRVSYNPFEHWLLSFSSKVTPYIPELSDMAGATRKINQLEYEKGNSSLKPYSEFSNKLGLTYSNDRFYAQLDYEFAYGHHPFAPYCFIQNNYVVYLTDTYNKSINQTCSSYVSYNIIKNIISVSGFCNYDRYLYCINGDRYNKAFWNYQGQLMINLSKSFSVDMAVIDNRKGLNGNICSMQEAATYIEASYKCGSWLFDFGVWNPCRNKIKLYEDKYYGNDVSKHVISYNYDKGNMFYIQVSFNFAKGKKSNTVNNKITNYDSEDGIIR